jgi:hypothetical protein
MKYIAEYNQRYTLYINLILYYLFYFLKRNFVSDFCKLVSNMKILLIYENFYPKINAPVKDYLNMQKNS